MPSHRVSIIGAEPRLVVRAREILRQSLIRADGAIVHDHADASQSRLVRARCVASIVAPEPRHPGSCAARRSRLDRCPSPRSVGSARTPLSAESRSVSQCCCRAHPTVLIAPSFPSMTSRTLPTSTTTQQHSTSTTTWHFEPRPSTRRWLLEKPRAGSEPHALITQ
jgi:hypothetical protein